MANPNTMEARAESAASKAIVNWVRVNHPVVYSSFVGEELHKLRVKERIRARNARRTKINK